MIDGPAYPLDDAYDNVNPNDKIWKSMSPYDYTQYCKKWSKSKLTCQPGDREPGRDVKTPSDYIPSDRPKTANLPRGYKCDEPTYFPELEQRGKAQEADVDDLGELLGKMRRTRGARK